MEVNGLQLYFPYSSLYHALDFICCRSWWGTTACDETQDPPGRTFLPTLQSIRAQPASLTGSVSVYQEGFLHFELVRLPSIVLLRTGNWDSRVRYELFTCQNETTCMRFKHSFICIKACCSVHIVPFSPCPDMWASLLYHFKFYYPTMLVSKLHWVASSRTDVQMQQ